MRKYIIQSIVCLGLISAILCVFSFQVSAVESQYGDVRTATVKIMSKGESSFYVTERKYIVDNRCDIRDQNNKKIVFNQLPVPCIANVAFVTVNGSESLCLKLQVQHLTKKATGMPEE